VPVIGSDQGGVRELVELYAGGWLFPRGDAAALAERMRALMDDPSLLSQATGHIRPVPAMADHIAAVVAIYEQEAHGH
jgi:glycosyltransferase involved in cell wall biosynthesis